MTVSSKQNTKAEIVVLPSIRHSSAATSVALRSRRGNYKHGQTAKLVSIREHLSCTASIGIDDLPFIEKSFSPQVADMLMISVRKMLDQEFGHLRVFRRHQVFVVRHSGMETLVAGLLRVQFHSCRIPLPVTRDGDGMSDICGVPLSWGVGHSHAEAERERLQKSKS